MDESMDPLRYYAYHSSISDPGGYVRLLEGLPDNVSALRRIVQGILLHVFWADAYGVKLSEERKQEVELRHAPKMLARIEEIDARPITASRPPEKRLVGNCRDFSMLLCAMLRHQGVPARARCGFAKYFEPGRHGDHWVCEYWKADERRWIMVDAQLDELQCQKLGIDFDPEDVPHEQFLPGGRAWELCRTHQADPDTFGIFDMHGLWFIRGDLVRDVASLNKVELLPWDCWGIIETQDEDLSAEDMALLDRTAALSLRGDDAFPKLRAVYESDARLRVPAVIRSYGSAGPRTVELAL